MSKQRVCVLGAGAAGLCAARHLSQRISEFDFVVFEKTSSIGGIWNYTDCVGLDNNGLPVHTSLYKHMRTNLPIGIMEFQDFRSKSGSFVSHTRVLQYLEEYAKHFDLIQFIKIIRITRIDNIWKISVKDIKNNEIKEEFYDSVFVCNGRYSKPNIPKDLKGIDKFKGQIIHSHDYRIPEPFAGQNVLVIGGGPSGIDISIEVSEKANQVVLCHRNSQPFMNLSQNLIQEMSEITEMSDKRIVFGNGNQRQIDCIILCTGYLTDFSFLDQSCAINVNQWGKVEGVYMHLVNQTYPSMAIWAIPIKVVPFPLYHQQVLFFIKCLSKQLRLPSKEEMQRQTEEEFLERQSMGWTQKYFHKMNTKLFYDYSDKLSKMADIPPFTPVFRQLYSDLEVMRKQDVIGYKNLNIKIISNDKYIID